MNESVLCLKVKQQRLGFLLSNCPQLLTLFYDRHDK